MKKSDNKFDTKAFVGKLISGGEEPKQKPGKRSHIPFRLNLLFFVIFTLFVALIARLGYVQIVDAENIEAASGNSSRMEIKESSPRGMIYDASGNVLAGNEGKSAITYTRGNNVTAETILAVAHTLNSLIDVPAADNLKDRDKQDYFLANPENYEMVLKRVTDEEKLDEDGNALTDGQLYAVAVGKVTPEEINFSPEELKIVTIFTRMNGAQSLNTVYIKNENVTDQELAVVAENASVLSGVSTGTDWSRNYTDNEYIRGILGSISTQETGLPAEKAEEYIAKGYSMNDRVGTSNLELQYEDYLQGKHTVYDVELDTNGSIASQTEKEQGSKGDNVVLTIDTEFQNRVQQILEANFGRIATSSGLYSPGAYAVVMDPDDGAVLAMGGVSHTPGTSEVSMDVTGAYLKVFEPGSTVKAATIASGYENGVISGNQTLTDRPIILPGVTKSSYFNRSGSYPVTAQQALEYSSNSYVMQVALKLLGLEYSPNMSIPYASNQVAGYEKLRSTYAEFGLGVSTGLDLPNEETGFIRTDYDNIDGANILDLSFGQFDTYSALQLAQYISTIHNRGTRVAAHVVDGIYGNNDSGGLDMNNLVKDISGETLNQINLSDSEWDIIERGLYNAVHGSSGWTTVTGLKAAPPSVTAYAKSGTAETVYVADSGAVVNTYNSNLVVYTKTADGDDIAISIILPQITTTDRTNQNIALEIMNAYYETQAN